MEIKRSLTSLNVNKHLWNCKQENVKEKFERDYNLFDFIQRGIAIQLKRSILKLNLGQKDYTNNCKMKNNERAITINKNESPYSGDNGSISYDYEVVPLNKRKFDSLEN